MGKVIKFRRGIGLRVSALVRRLLLVALLMTGLDLVHDGRVGWPATVAPGLAGALSDATASARDWIEQSPAFCSECSDEVVADAPSAAERRRNRAFPPARREVPPAPDADESVADGPVAGGPSVEADLSGHVDQVIDGDSLRVRVAGLGLIEVRLHGIDTPEYDQPFGSAASRELRRLAANRRVVLVSETTDSYGRLVATVYRDDLNINREMVRRGYAWWYRRYALFNFALRSAEKEAREQRRGLWRDENPVPPWEWRRR